MNPSGKGKSRAYRLARANDLYETAIAKWSRNPGDLDTVLINERVYDLGALPPMQFFYTRREASAAAAKIHWPKNSARLIDLPLGRQRWAISDDHNNVLTAAGYARLLRELEANPGRRPVDTITDRAKRYRANSDVPAGPRVCGLCGSRDSLGVGHLDGYEEHGEAENLMWMCKACNSLADAVLKAQGMGRSTNQYNPGIFSGLFRSRETYRTKGGGHPAERAEIRRRAADVERAEVRAAEIADRRRALAERAAAPKQVGRYKGTTIYRAGPVGDRYLYSSLDPDSHFDSVRDLKSVVDQFKNPASNLSEWRRAVDVLRGEVDGSARQAVRTIRSTPPARRLEYLNQVMRRNPDVPTFKQYAWAVTQHQKGDYIGSQQGFPEFSEGAHDEGGAIIHATPPAVRREYAARLAQSRKRRRAAEVPF
jgi:hypothetical protein